MRFLGLLSIENDTYQGLPLMSVPERRWYVFFYPRGKDRGGEGELHVANSMR